MSFTMFVTWVLVGVVAGVVAGLVMKRGGHGLKNDIILGLAGSIGGSWIFRGVGVFPEAGVPASGASHAAALNCTGRTSTVGTHDASTLASSPS